MPKTTLFLALYLLLFAQLKAQSYNSLSEAFAHKEEAKSLDLSKQNLDKLDPSFSELHQLTHLNLSENNLRDFPFGSFLETKQLEWVDASHNQFEIADVTRFLYSPKIRYLDLSYNPIKNLKRFYLTERIPLEKQTATLTPKILASPSLEKLIIKHTELSMLYEEFAVFPNLKYLDLSHNKIVAAGDALFNLKELDSLILSHNDFIFLPSRDSIRAYKLSYIDVSHNPRLVDIDQLFNQFPNLKHINASYLGDGSHYNMRFGLVSSKKFYKNSPVKTLLLTHSHLKSVPKAMGYMENLEYLDLSHNELQSLPKSFKRLKKLKKLDLRGNPFLEKEKENCRKYLPDCEILF
ncbi:leucine-rich repeat domain-containing protein [Saprospira sp. CCB-QB6]|uniref:leucine-rich repeat domain-containing protein n=1 Tax=Saprospira sp. CCB-QB6 TaxID=3023936 RepID=UPI0023491739|nr:leucine-rich repeat domain-containing protein [Saprospira sp. CCB-QB6]WCL82093.1 leucine-rich repeat domain-containing protein [Saprospira sp. CCB-QB6]